MDQPKYECLEWDSKHLGVSCGRILVTHLPPNSNQKKLQYEIENILAENKADFILIKLPSYFNELLIFLIQKAFSFIDVEMMLKYQKSAIHSDIENNYHVEFLNQCDPYLFESLAGEMMYSRYYLDSQISNDKAKSIWTDSIRNHCSGRSDELAITYSNQVPAGLICIKFRENKINLNIVGVIKEYQGIGIGTASLKKVIEKYFGSYDIYVEALSQNNRAVRFYQNNGFFVSSLHYILHFWNKSISDH